MVEEMDRSLSKFLYEFLPGNTLNHAHIQASGRIRSVNRRTKAGQYVELEAPEEFLIGRVKEHLYRWPNSEELLDIDLYDDVDIVVPGGAVYHTYPRTFECPQCGMFIRFDYEDEREIASLDTDSLFSCDNCDAKLSVTDQLPFVAICECGAIDQLWAPTHSHDGTELNMKLDRPTTRMSSWEWHCVHPGCSESRPFMATPVSCPDPACDNDDLMVTNHTDSSSFYPQSEDFVNAQEGLENIDRTRYRAKVISDYVLATDIQYPSESEIKKKAAELLGGTEEFMLADEDEERRAREQAKTALLPDREEHRRHIKDWLENRSGFDDRQKASLTQECYEYLSLTKNDEYRPTGDYTANSIQELIESPEKTHLSESTLASYRDILNSLNIEELHLIEDIPLTTVTYGYTRVKSEPQNVRDAVDTEASPAQNDDPDRANPSNSEQVDLQLNTFTTQSDPFPTFYAQEMKAEGVLVKLDPEFILDWLVENNVITDANRPSPDDARMWFVDRIAAPSRYESLVDNQDETHLLTNERQCISRHVYSLINTYAHVFMNTMGSLSGHQRESLVERLMPHTLSFLVYKRPDTDQALGTVLTLFEERFEQFHTQLQEQATCPLDRVCYADENGACEHCLYLPTMSTDNTNHNLGRATLFGGRFDEGKPGLDEQEIDGYLSL